MNRAQQIILSLGLLVVAAFCLRPPYQWESTTYLINVDSSAPHKVGTIMENAGHYWIWNPPPGTGTEKDNGYERTMRNAGMDWPRLGVYVGLTLALTLSGAFMISNKK